MGFAVAGIFGINPGVAVFAFLGRDEGLIFIEPGQFQLLRPPAHTILHNLSTTAIHFSLSAGVHLPTVPPRVTNGA
ncbi:hypothetical protein B840_12525 (plasmid) [Corynebacterium marinum DSM 44953]|uniref:Uncharacterized protein n=1 Tax=Corynebacterium marinum DSM 44953 TaxID=1224162 RepID=A0A0B6TQ73_9CORY|nr:hypothetical protein B840_12525 [Corynebacterium marinum DSM 44953]